MSRVTSKLQVTIPKAIAQRYGIKPGVNIDWLPAGEAIRVVPHGSTARSSDPARRLALFDAASERERRRPSREAAAERGWLREELYRRAQPD